MPSLRQWARQALFPRITIYHIAAILLTSAAAFANAKMGWNFGSTGVDRVIYAFASIGADLWSLGGFLLAAGYIAKKHHGPAVAAGIVTALTLTYSVISGLSFVTQVTEARLGPRRAIERTDTQRAGELEAIKQRLAALPNGKPAGELQAEMDKILNHPKANGCKTQDGPYTREHCPRYFTLKGQHAAAVEREKLVTARQNLLVASQAVQTIEASDPLEDALKRLGVTILEGLTQPYVALLFVLLVVLGGPLAMWCAEARICTDPDAASRPTDAQQSTDVDDAENKTEPITQQTPKTPRPRPKSVGERPRKLPTVPPAGEKVLKNLRRRGGHVTAKSKAKLADAVGVPRTSYGRVIGRLEEDSLIKTSHGPQGYKVALH